MTTTELHRLEARFAAMAAARANPSREPHARMLPSLVAAAWAEIAEDHPLALTDLGGRSA